MNSLATIMLRPAVPWWILIPAVCVFAVLAWATYRRCGLPRRLRWTLWGLRMAALAIVVWLVLLPARRVTRTRREPALLAVVVDESASMTESVSDEMSRADRVTSFLEGDDFDKVTAEFRLRFFAVGSKVREAEGKLKKPSFDAPRSNIVQGLQEVAARLRAENMAGIILLSDGLDQSGMKFSQELRTLPIYPLELEKPVETRSVVPRDYFIGDLSYPEKAVAGWDARVEALVRRRHEGDESCRVNLYRDNRKISSRELVFNGQDSFRRVTFTVHPGKAGDIYYRLKVETKPEDQRPDNNQREFMIAAVTSENRVLYLEGAPRWEFKFFKNALLNETAFRLSAFVRAAQDGFVSFGEGDGFAHTQLPALTSDNLRRYRVIVLGNLPATALSAEDIANVNEFVESGGGLLLMGGAEAYSPGGIAHQERISEMLPVIPDPQGEMKDGRFDVEFTGAERTHPAFQTIADVIDLPPVLSVWQPATAREYASKFIVTAEDAPVISFRRFGEGKVAMLLSDSMWRWQFSGKKSVRKSLYKQFMTQLVHWLSPTRQQMLDKNMLQLIMKAREYELKEDIIIGATYGEGVQPEKELTSEVITPDGRRLALPMQESRLAAEVGLDTPIPGFVTRFIPVQTGRYQVKVTDQKGIDRAEGQFLVKETMREKTGAPADRQLLKALAKHSGGRFVSWNSREDFFATIPNNVQKIEISEEYPLWNWFPWFLILVCVFITEWWLRRRLDLV